MHGSATPTICRICKENCGILVDHAKDGIRIKGNPHHPISKGFICFRGRRFSDIRHSPQRITKPLLRRGDKLVPIPYDVAVETLATAFTSSKDSYGPESIALLKGESLKHQEIRDYMAHFTHALGSPNYLSVGSICHQALAMGHGLTYGGIPKPDFHRMKIALLWGSNMAVSSVHLFKQLRKSVASGTKLVVIDPCETRTTQWATLHLKITPGTDGYLALAFIKAAVEKYDLAPALYSEFGWEILNDLVASNSYNDFLEKTGLDYPVFHEACQLIFSNLPAWNLAGSGLELQPGGVQSIRAVACLNAILDPENRAGPMAYQLNELPGRNNYPVTAEPIGSLEAPLFTQRRGEGQAMFLPKAIMDNKPYPVKTLLIAGANPLLTFPDPSIQKEAYRKLDFLAVCDLFMTSTAQMADLILPAADFLDNVELHDYGQQTGKPYLGLVRPIGEKGPGWPVWKWLFELSRHLNLQSFFPWKDNESAIRYKLTDKSIDFDTLLQSPASAVSYEATWRNKAPNQPPNRIVNYYSSAVVEVGCDGLPTPRSFQLPFSKDSNFPFWLSTGDRVDSYQHSQFRLSERHLNRNPLPVVEMHPQAATSLGIKPGDMVNVSTRNGELNLQAAISSEVREDCLRITHGWEEANANELTTAEFTDPLSGFPWCRALPAKIVKKEATI